MSQSHVFRVVSFTNETKNTTENPVINSFAQNVNYHKGGTDCFRPQRGSIPHV